MSAHVTTPSPLSPSVNGRLSGRTCVIAGAGGAIGEAVAARFLSEGAAVIGIDRRPLDTQFPTVTADLSDDDQTRIAFEQIGAEHGVIHVLYVNAGSADRADTSVLASSAEVWQRVFDANLTPAVTCCRHAVPQMESEQGGSIILTGSFLAGIGAATAQMAFSAAKAAVTQLGRDLGIHLARRNIRVNTLSIGPIETPELRQMFDRIGEEQVARRMSRVPLGRPASLDELAASAVYLASPDSGYITGSVLPLDGGIPRAYTIPQ